MTKRYPGMDPETQSGHKSFYSDENLMKRAVPATYADVAPLRPEDAGHATENSPMLSRWGRSDALSLPDVEMDGDDPAGRLEGHDMTQQAPSPYFAPPPNIPAQPASGLTESDKRDIARMIAEELKNG